MVNSGFALLGEVLLFYKIRPCILPFGPACGRSKFVPDNFVSKVPKTIWRNSARPLYFPVFGCPAKLALSGGRAHTSIPVREVAKSAVLRIYLETTALLGSLDTPRSHRPTPPP